MTEQSRPAPDGAVVRVTTTESTSDPLLYPGLEAVTLETTTTATVFLPRHLRAPLCSECDGPALPGGLDFTHDASCELAAVDWATHEQELTS